jgi:hypothetical protein
MLLRIICALVVAVTCSLAVPTFGLADDIPAPPDDGGGSLVAPAFVDPESPDYVGGGSGHIPVNCGTECDSGGYPGGPCPQVYQADGKSQFYNWDFHSQTVDCGERDMPVTMVFGYNASEGKVKNALSLFYPYGSLNQYGRVRNNSSNSLQWIGDGGRKTSVPPFRNCDRHYRLYGQNGDRSYTPFFGYYVIATTHFDCNEGYGDDYYGYNESAAQDVEGAVRILTSWTVYPNLLTMGNTASGWDAAHKHFYQSDGMATYVYVP